jgi:hypothetical protein
MRVLLNAWRAGKKPKAGIGASAKAGAKLKAPKPRNRRGKKTGKY